MSVRGCDLCGDTCSDRLHRYGTEMLAVCSLYAVYGFMLDHWRCELNIN